MNSTGALAADVPHSSIAILSALQLNIARSAFREQADLQRIAGRISL